MPLVNKTTSAESPASALTGTALVRIVQSGGNFKATASQIAALGPASVATTKGDLIVGTTSGPTRLPVGTDGQQPYADSTQTGGIRWGNDLSDTASASKGAGLVGFNSALSYAINTVGSTLKNILGSAGSTFITFLSNLSGAQQRTVQSKLSDVVSVFDFMTPAQIADVQAGTVSLDVTAACQAALSSVAWTTWQGSVAAMKTKGGGSVYFPPGTYKITSTLIIGANTNVYGFAPTGSTAGSITANTGAIIYCAFSNQQQWAFSSATFVASTGLIATYAKTFAGSDVDAGNINLTNGITIRGLTINGNACYGGIRLLGCSDFNISNISYYNVGIGTLLNACYGGSYSKIHAIYDIYGLVIMQCNALAGLHYYADKGYSGWSVSGTNQLLNLGNFGSGNGAYMPNWDGKHIGIYLETCINLSLKAHVSEHTDIGFVIDNTVALVLDGYAEANAIANYAFVASSGVVTAYSNAVTGTYEYAFGVNNSIDLQQCTPGRFYVGNSQNSIAAYGVNSTFSPYNDWAWNDNVQFISSGKILQSFNVSSTGTATAVYGNITLDEAMRRISISPIRDWSVLIAAGTTVTTASQLAFQDKKITFNWQSSGTKPNISVGAAGGGYIYRWTFIGNCDLRFENINVSFPTTPVGASGDQALINAGLCLNLRLAIDNAIVNLGNAYSLLGTFSGGSLNLQASWSGSGITSTAPAPILRNSGAAVVVSNQVGTTCDANIKSLGTNGYQATSILASNF